MFDMWPCRELPSIKGNKRLLQQRYLGFASRGICGVLYVDLEVRGIPVEAVTSPKPVDIARSWHNWGLSVHMGPPDASSPNLNLRERLLNGEPLRLRGARPEDRTLMAEWILEAASRGAKICISHAIIRGALNLRYVSFKDEVCLIRCTVEERADFSYATFQRKLKIYCTRFERGADFHGASAEYDVNFIHTEFSGGKACFEDIQVRGDFYVWRVLFAKGVKAKLARAHIEKSAVFWGTIFEEEVDLGYAHIVGEGSFSGAVFKKNVDFNSVKIGQLAVFSPLPKKKLPAATFGSEADFTGICIGADAEFGGVVFKENVIFNSAKIGGSAIFCIKDKDKVLAATFGGNADFIGICIGIDADFRAVKFKDTVSFNSANIGQLAVFCGVPLPGKNAPAATFDGYADFTRVGIGSNAEFHGARFRGEVSFNSAKIDGAAFFSRQDHDKVLGATFSGHADFIATKFGGPAEFHGSQFYNKQTSATFDRSEFSMSARFSQAVFSGDVSFGGAHFTGKADYSKAHFFGKTSFAYTKFARELLFKPSECRDSQRQFQGGVDLRGCTYEHIDADWESLLDRLDPYDRQPYTQLEKFFRVVGKDRDADEVYLKRNRCESNRIKLWGAGAQWATDRLYKWILRYGVRPYPLVLIAIVCLMLGIGTLSHKDAAIPKDSKDAQATPYGGSIWDATALSVNQFFPVELPVGSQWKPSPKNAVLSLHIPFYGNFSLYKEITAWAFASYFLKLPGWILVPLAVSALAGLLRRRGT